MARKRQFSEYDGGGTMPSTIHPKPESALTPGEKLRLMSLTGQETDTNAPLDLGFWQGNNYFDPDEVPAEDTQRIRREREARRQNELRYRESRR